MEFREILFSGLLLILTAWLGFLLGLFWHQLNVHKPIIYVWILQLLMAFVSLGIALEFLGWFNLFGVIIGLLCLIAVMCMANLNRHRFTQLIEALKQLR